MTTLARTRPDRSTPTTPSSDEDLLLLIRAGHPGAFGELYERYESEARRFARRLVPPDDLDDVVSESFAKVLQALRSGKGPVDHPERYLMVTVRTTASTVHARRAKGEEAAARLAAHATEVAPEELGDDALTDAFRSLSPRWRQVIWWTEVEGRRPAEVGRMLDVSADAAAALAYRARRALREAYDQVRAERPPIPSTAPGSAGAPASAA